MTPPPSAVRPSLARRRRFLAVAVAAALASVPACTGDGSDAADPTSTSTSAADPATTSSVTSSTVPDAVDDTSRLALACNAARDRRTEVATEGSRDAALGVLAAIGRGTLPEAETLDDWADAFDDQRGDLAEVRFVLADTEAAPAQADAWAVVATAGDQEITLLADRADLLRSHDLDRITRDWPTDPGGTDQAVVLALSELSLGRGDCELAFTGSGVPAEDGREFLLAAADGCTAIVDRRRLTGYQAATDTVLGAVAAVLEDDAVPADDLDDLAAALDVAVAEWEATAADLAPLDPADAPDPAAWQQVLDTVADRIQGFQRRADAVASGDAAEIAEAFRPTAVFEQPGLTGFEPLGLDQRDCGAIQG